MSVLTMVKYHGLGNDFLVVLDGRGLDAAAVERAGDTPGQPGGPSPTAAADHVGELARALC